MNSKITVTKVESEFYKYCNGCNCNKYNRKNTTYFYFKVQMSSMTQVLVFCRRCATNVQKAFEAALEA